MDETFLTITLILFFAFLLLFGLGFIFPPWYKVRKSTFPKLKIIPQKPTKEFKQVKIGFLINTCKQFKEDNIDDLIDCFENAGVNSSRIMIVSGQEDGYENSFYRNIKFISVKYTALNHTALVYLSSSDLVDKFDYWMILPETVRFGVDFPKLLASQLREKILQLNLLPPVIPLYNCEGGLPPSMDIGILSSDWIQFNLKDFTDNVSIIPSGLEDVKKLKEIMVKCEDFILAKPIPHHYRRHIKNYSPSLWHAINKTQKTKAFVYANTYSRVAKGFIVRQEQVHVEIIEQGNVQLKRSYFSKLDLTKYQRNFKGPKEPTVLTSTRLKPEEK